ncbi:hypothetical protein [Lactococcus lactis]|uniref:hypothetical protein n=1 Tax=Lactococcus lactis TaxID=1358 RepID=UPI0022E623A4|nr:hypothetical protein [Lactococcus lactis]MDR7697146.1 hypothetical protein [Lactococcus lactis]
MKKLKISFNSFLALVIIATLGVFMLYFSHIINLSAVTIILLLASASIPWFRKKAGISSENIPRSYIIFGIALIIGTSVLSMIYVVYLF